jgi:hypothetical protein
VTKWRFENNWGQQEEFDKFNQEIAETSDDFNTAIQIFEAKMALSLIDDKAEIVEIGGETRKELISATKKTLRSACNNNYLQYLEIVRLSKEKKPDQTKKQDYVFYDFLHYWEPKETVVQKGEFPVEAVGYKMVEGITDDGEPYGDEMHVRFVLPRNFLLSANIGDIEIENWLSSIDEVFIEYAYDRLTGLPPEVFSVSLNSFVNHNMSLANLKQQMEQIRHPEDIIGKDEDHANLIGSILNIYEKQGTMKLFPFLKKEIEI